MNAANPPLRSRPLVNYSVSEKVPSDADRRVFPRAIVKGIEIPYNRGLHLFAIFTACTTLVLIVAGALVTSNDAGLSVPDWPTTFGSFYKIPHMVGGVRYEHGHRMVAEFTGLLTIILAVWTWVAEKRHWLRVLGLAALATVIVQGILGGLTVLFFCPHLSPARTPPWRRPSSASPSRSPSSPAAAGSKSNHAPNSTSAAPLFSL